MSAGQSLNSRALSRRFFLKGADRAAAAPVMIGLPPLAAMFNSAGTAYAAETESHRIPTDSYFWFNGNGISEKYWIPAKPATSSRSPRASRRSRRTATTSTW